MADYQTIDYRNTDRVLIITLNRPDVMNAFTVQMADELVDAFVRASEDDDVGAIIVTGAGRAFCAGMDLSVDGNVFGLNEKLKPTLEEMRSRLDDQDIARGVRDTGGRVTLAIFECKKPIIAAINGVAVGIGATMTCAMDIRLAATGARIGFVFNNIGIVPEACSTWFLPRIVGISQALEWNYTGEVISADVAQRAGLVKAVYAENELLEQAHKIALRIARQSPVAVALTRQMVYRNSASSDPLDAHILESLSVFHTSQHDGKEGVAAFLEKRSPEFKSSAANDMPDFYPWQ